MDAPKGVTPWKPAEMVKMTLWMPTAAPEAKLWKSAMLVHGWIKTLTREASTKEVTLKILQKQLHESLQMHKVILRKPMGEDATCAPPWMIKNPTAAKVPMWMRDPSPALPEVQNSGCPASWLHKPCRQRQLILICLNPCLNCFAKCNRQTPS